MSNELTKLEYIALEILKTLPAEEKVNYPSTTVDTAVQLANRLLKVTTKARDTTETIPLDVLQWLAFGERGASAEAIVEAVTGVKCAKHGVMVTPAEAGDFARCVRMLEQCPTVEKDFHKMKEVSMEWNLLCANWIGLRELLVAKDTYMLNVALDRCRRP